MEYVENFSQSQSPLPLIPTGAKREEEPRVPQSPCTSSVTLQVRNVGYKKTVVPAMLTQHATPRKPSYALTKTAKLVAEPPRQWEWALVSQMLQLAVCKRELFAKMPSEL